MTSDMNFMEMPGNVPKIFLMVRKEDVSGVSGTGPVAWLVQFPDGRVVIAWFSRGLFTFGVAESLKQAEQIHGHDGRTNFVEITKGVACKACGCDKDHTRE